jgi:hypothetical protein
LANDNGKAKDRDMLADTSLAVVVAALPSSALQQPRIPMSIR